jgi:hypothetical protein
MCSCHPLDYEAGHFLDAFKSSRAGGSSHGRAGTHNQGPNIMARLVHFWAWSGPEIVWRQF